MLANLDDDNFMRERANIRRRDQGREGATTRSDAGSQASKKKKRTRLGTRETCCKKHKREQQARRSSHVVIHVVLLLNEEASWICLVDFLLTQASKRASFASEQALQASKPSKKRQQARALAPPPRFLAKQEACKFFCEHFCSLLLASFCPPVLLARSP